MVEQQSNTVFEPPAYLWWKNSGGIKNINVSDIVTYNQLYFTSYFLLLYSYANIALFTALHLFYKLLVILQIQIINVN